MEKYSLYEVFTPAQPASLTFIERKTVNNQFLRALKTPGKQIIVYGQSGSGKTTLVKKKLEKNQIKCIITQCMKGIKFHDIFIDAFNKLDAFYCESTDSLDGSKIGGGISASYFGIKGSLSSELNTKSQIKSKRAVDLPITPQTLAMFFGEANAIWIIEDFHKMDPAEKPMLSQIMKIFMDSSSKYLNLKIIAIGAVNTAREVVLYDPEMKNRVAEILIPLMTARELEEIIIKGNELLRFNFSNNTTEKIATYSSGLASVTHQLSLLICEAEDIKQTIDIDKKANDKSLEIAIDDYLNENSDSLKHIYDMATKCLYKRKFETPEEILLAILQNKKESQTIREIAESLKTKSKHYKETNLRKYVNELTTPERGEILRYDEVSDKYSFSTPFIKAYSFCTLNNDKEETFITRSQFMENLKITLQEAEAAKEQFLHDIDIGTTSYDNFEDDEE